jgi:dihydrolipoamide dehydrogenase
MGEAEARAAGIEPRVGTFPLRASGRALTLDAPEGFVKTVADDATGRILGMIVVGANASELIAEGALAIEMGAFLDDVAAVIHPHPTLSEGILESVEAAMGQAVHVLNRKR